MLLFLFLDTRVGNLSVGHAQPGDVMGGHGCQHAADRCPVHAAGNTEEQTAP